MMLVGRVLRGSLPVGALAIFVLTLRTCFRVAREAGHLEIFDQMEWTPVISFFGESDPERAWFRRGFTALAVIVTVTLWIRGRQLGRETSLGSAWFRRGTVWATSALAIVCLLVMTWIPDDVSPVHFFAALATFFFLSVRGIVETTLAIRVFRARGFGVAHAAQVLWGLACPIASAAYVAKWVSEGNVNAQYLAVGLQFAYFLALTPELSRAEPAPRS